jgi:diaminopimelate decarboxylase
VSWEPLFPLTATLNPSGRLSVGGCELASLAREYGTPLYVFDEQTLRDHALAARAAFDARRPGTAVLYATKAYYAPFLARLFAECGLGVDVTSAAEILLARRAGVPPPLICLHGNNKTEEEIRAALDAGVGRIVVDYLDEIGPLDAAACDARLKPGVLFRLAPGIDPHTHRFLTTGTAGSKFGMPVHDGTLARAARQIASAGNLEFVGLHMHLGSQLFDLDAVDSAIRVLVDTAYDLESVAGVSIRELNVGGGWGVGYNESQTTLDVDQVASRITGALAASLERRPLKRAVQLMVEPGRWLVARSAVALYTVGYIKRTEGGPVYASIDGGMGDNIRPALYGAEYAAFAVERMCEPATHEYAIAGRYCEQGDVVIERSHLPEMRRGDLLGIPVAGAYQLPMASNYNLIPRPAVVLVRDGAAHLVRRRETLADMLACDIPETPR